jgi:hypothetical protein
MAKAGPPPTLPSGPVRRAEIRRLLRKRRKKRCHYSLGGRTVVSVWNQGRGREAPPSCTVFHDGMERTIAVRELLRPFSDRPDIRIGVLDLASL